MSVYSTFKFIDLFKRLDPQVTYYNTAQQFPIEAPLLLSEMNSTVAIGIMYSPTGQIKALPPEIGAIILVQEYSHWVDGRFTVEQQELYTRNYQEGDLGEISIDFDGLENMYIPIELD